MDNPFLFQKKKKIPWFIVIIASFWDPGGKRWGWGGGGGVGLVPVLWVHDTCESYR